MMSRYAFDIYDLMCVVYAEEDVSAIELKYPERVASNLRVQDRALYEEFLAECADLKKVKRQVALINLQTTSYTECQDVMHILEQWRPQTKPGQPRRVEYERVEYEHEQDDQSYDSEGSAWSDYDDTEDDDDIYVLPPSYRYGDECEYDSEDGERSYGYEDECRDSYEADVDNYGRTIVPARDSVIEERAYEVQRSGGPYRYGSALEEYEYDARDDDANYEDLEDIYSYYRERGSYTGRYESTDPMKPGRVVQY